MRRCENPMPLASKEEFIEQWLVTQSNAFHCESSLYDSSLSRISDSIESKKDQTSLLRNLKQIKYANSTNKKDDSSRSLEGQTGINSPLQSAGNRIYKNNGELQRYKTTFRDSPKPKIGQRLPFTFANTMTSVNHQSSVLYRMIHNQNADDPIIKDIKSDSPDITDIESIPSSSSVFEFSNDSIEFESPRKFDIKSPIFALQNTNSQSGLSSIIRLDQKLAMSNDEDETMRVITNDVSLDLSISTLDSESDTASIFSEECRTISSVFSGDSDQTFSTRNYLSNNIKHANKFQSSPIISENCVSLQNSKTKTDSIDPGIYVESLSDLRSSKFENPDSYPLILDTLIKKRKKPKKGSLIGQLRTLITGQTSFFRIWRHQLAEIRSGVQNNQFILLKIIHSTWKFNRQCLSGLVISDMHNLLGSIFQKFSGSNKMSNVDSSLSRKVITILTAPEIVGTINFDETSTLKIYPPWKVVDANKHVLSISYFHSIMYNFTSADKNIKVNDKIIQKFDCSCLVVNQLVKSCTTKFINIKPNSTRYLFDN